MEKKLEQKRTGESKNKLIIRKKINNDMKMQPILFIHKQIVKSSKNKVNTSFT